LAVLIWERAWASESSAFQAVGLTFIGTLLTLAILEHWFLVLPLPSEVLWSWGLRSRAQRRAPDIDAKPKFSPVLVVINKD
jgi:hypothetical protein